MTLLRHYFWDICSPAFEKGRREGVRVYEFLREPLTEAFGHEFYRALCAGAEVVRQAGLVKS